MRNGLLLILGIIIALVLYARNTVCDCKARISYDDVHINNGINLDELFQAADSTELATILNDWDNFALASESFEIVSQRYFGPARRQFVVEHQVAGVKHYGAIILPTKFDSIKTYPAFVWLGGLNQVDPSLNLDHYGDLKTLCRALSDYFIIIPSFRGQALVVNYERYCSDGFFGDAFDGATDDALRLLYATRQAYPAIDTTKIAVAGQSRGGTVALLMAARDTTLNAVASLAGPTDFFSKAVYNRYHKQFKYQFLSHVQPMEEIRAKMIKSSPIYFIDRYPNALLLVQGTKDQTVPVSNAEVLIDKLKGRENFEYHLVDAGHRLREMERLANWLRKL